MLGVTQKPIELILARNLMSSLSTPAFLVDEGGTAGLLQRGGGQPARQALRGGRARSARRSGARCSGPSTTTASRFPTTSCRWSSRSARGAPRTAIFRSAPPTGTQHEIEVSAFPILTAHGSRGAIAVFWPTDQAATGHEWPAKRTGLHAGEALGNPRVGALPRAGDDPLRRQHLLRPGHALRRHDARPRRGHRHPQPRPGAGRGAGPAAHPAHPPAPRPHPGPGLLRPRLPARRPRS